MRCLKLCQIEVYYVSADIFYKLTKYIGGLEAVRPSARSQSLCYILLIRYISTSFPEQF